MFNSSIYPYNNSVPLNKKNQKKLIIFDLKYKDIIKF